MLRPVPMVLGIDTGGTMSDTVLVSEDGRFVIGKAQTTPENEAIGILNSLKDAAKKWNMTVDEVAKSLRTIIYSGTIMLNRVLTREGLQLLGIITTAGFEDTLRMGRARQSWNTLSYAERLHAISHFHPEPLVPRNMIMGVRERILVTGVEMIPLYESEVEEAARKLIERGAKAIIIMFLNSWANPSHEIRAAEIVEKVAKEKGVSVPIFMSHRIAPVLGELRRLNAVVLQVYAAEPSREQFRKMEEAFRAREFKAPLYIFTNYGTVVPPTFERLIHTVTSGPSAGNVAVQYLANLYGLDYMVGTDVGGTSFDVTTVVARRPIMNPFTIVERYEAAVPSIATESIGAGTGSYIRVDPVTKSLRVGPDSAGYRIGVSWRDGGVETVTINDAMVILGYLNPNYFLGGEIKLDKDRALKEFERQVAQPLGIDVYEAAWGSYMMVADHMRLHLEGIVRGLGFSPENFYLVSYGGGGPSFVAAYTASMRFAGVMVPEVAPAFSAWGTTLADIGIRAEKSLEAYVPPLPGVKPLGMAEMIMKGVAEMLKIKIKGTAEMEGIRGLLSGQAINALNSAWKELRSYVEEEFKRAGLAGEITWRPAVRMLYAGMLDDIEVDAPAMEVDEGSLQKLCESFDNLFEKVYASAARSREFGYVVTRAVLTGYMALKKPMLLEEKEETEKIPENAFKGEREMYWNGKWYRASLYEMGLLRAGNRVKGPAIIEAPAATYVIPPGFSTRLDRRRVFWLEGGG